jgi:hypothetical protein
VVNKSNIQLKTPSRVALTPANRLKALRKEWREYLERKKISNGGKSELFPEVLRIVVFPHIVRPTMKALDGRDM